MIINYTSAHEEIVITDEHGEVVANCTIENLRLSVNINKLMRSTVDSSHLFKALLKQVRAS